MIDGERVCISSTCNEVRKRVRGAADASNRQQLRTIGETYATLAKSAATLERSAQLLERLKRPC